MVKVRDLPVLFAFEDYKVLVDLGNSWLEPTLYFKHKDSEEITFTAQSGEMENDFHEFFIDLKYLNEEQITILLKMLSEMTVENVYTEMKKTPVYIWPKLTLNESFKSKLSVLLGYT